MAFGLPHVFEQAERQSPFIRHIDQQAGGGHRDRQRLLHEQVEAGFEGGGADLMMHGEGGEIVDGVDRAGRDHIAVVGKDGDLGVGLELVDVDMRRGQRVAGLGRQHGCARGRALAPFAEHERVVTVAGAEGGDAKVVAAGLAQEPVALQMGVEDAAAADDTDADHVRELRLVWARPRFRADRVPTSCCL